VAGYRRPELQTAFNKAKAKLSTGLVRCVMLAHGRHVPLSPDRVNLGPHVRKKWIEKHTIVNGITV
jgi:hypothetical protein